MANPVQSRKAIPSGKTKPQQGFVLPLVVVAGLIIAAGIMALSTRTFAGLVGSIRLGQSREAQQAAESGLATILRELNRNYPYLLNNNCAVGEQFDPESDCQQWLNADTSLACNGRATDTSKIASWIQKDISNNLASKTSRSRYQLLSYVFDGDSQQGGEARIKVKGESFATNPDGSRQPRAVTVVEQTLSILPKQGTLCNTPGTVSSSITNRIPNANSTFAGLLGSDRIVLGNNNVSGDISGNIVCLEKCTNNSLITPIISDPNAKISFKPNITLPPVPEFPFSGFTAQSIKLSGSKTESLIAGDTNNSRCIYDSSSGITHCLISSMELSGQSTLKIFTVPGKTILAKESGRKSNVTIPKESMGMRLYFPLKDSEITCTISPCSVINVSGGASINHEGTPNHLALFGLPASDGPPTQTVSFGGGSYAVAMFIYFPEGTVGINGGSSTNTSSYQTLTGAVWAKVLGLSQSNVASWKVPDNMGGLLYETFGRSFNVVGAGRAGSRVPGSGEGKEYGAVGSSNWQLFQRTIN